MNKLIEAGLFGQGLISIERPNMVSRYYSCLQEMGIEPVDLDKFSIDGMGFSPEIAAAKDDNFYLSHGTQINHLAVIATPEQFRKPIYFPINSFDRRLLLAYFNEFMKQIVDITTNVAIGLDIDSAITQYESPVDLLSVDSVEVVSTADRLMDAAREQKRLIDSVNAGEDNWADSAVRARIIDSAARHGDLRYRQLEIPDWRFGPIDSFHTNAFGGVFIIRLPDRHDMIILEDDEQKKFKIKGLDVSYVSDANLPDKLEDAGLIEINANWYGEHPEILEEKRDAVIAHAVCQEHPDIDYLSLSSAYRKSLLKACTDNLPPWLPELEKLCIDAGKNKRLDAKKISRQLRLVLLRPAANLSSELEEVVGRLLSRLQPYSLLGTFTHDKNAFYKKYSEKMTPSEQDWSIAEILKHYEPRMHQLPEKPAVQS